MSSGSAHAEAVRSRRRFRILLLCGLLVRLAALPLAGTGDMEVWKTWSYAGTSGLLTMYGVGGSPPVRGIVSWGTIHTTVDYPPGTIAGLAVIGHAYRQVDPEYVNSRRLTMAIKLPIVIMDLLACLLVWQLARHATGSHRAGRTAALFYWLNPAIILDGAVLGYLDPWMAVPVLAALAAAHAGAAVWCGAALAVAVVVKLQALFVVPLAGMLLWHGSQRSIRASATATAAFCGVIVLALLPFAIIGALPNLVQGVGSLLRHDMLSGTAANAWWIVTWALRVWYAIPDLGAWDAWTMTVRILGLRRFVELGYPNPRPIMSVVVIAVAVWAFYRANNAVRRGAAAGTLLAAGAFAVHAYFMLAVQVHENHLYLALPLLAVATAIDSRYRGVTVAISAVMTLNLLLFYGVGRDFPPLPRTATLIDSTVLLSIAHLFVFAWHARVLRLVTRRHDR